MRDHLWLLGSVLVAGCGFQSAQGDGGAPGGCGNFGTQACKATITTGYQPLGQATLDSRWASFAPAAAQVAVVWEAAGPMTTSPSNVYFGLVDNLGRVSGTRQLASGRSPSLFRVDNQLTLLWRQLDTIYLQKLDDTGVLQGTAALVFGPIADDFAVAWNGSEYGVVTNGANGDIYQIYWLRVGRDGTLLAGPTLLPDGGNSSVQPAIAWTGCQYAVAWTDLRPGTPAVYYARFDSQFVRKAPDASLSPASMRGSFPTVAAQANGGTVVCYEVLISGTNQDIFCTRLDPDGHPTSTQQLTRTLTPSQSPHAVTHGQNTWVLWDDYTLSASQPEVDWQFLDETGAPMLAQPKNDPSTDNGWRAHGYAANELYFVKFYGDPVTSAFSAHAVTLTCF